MNSLLSMSQKELDDCLSETSCGNYKKLYRLFEELKNPIFRYALSITKNYHNAEDVLQDTFVEIIKNAGKYEKGSNPKAWIFAIVRNHCLDVLKKNRKNEDIEDEKIANMVLPHGNDFSEKNIFVNEGLESLEEDEKQIVLLHIYAGLKLKDIADIMNIPYNSVRSKYGYSIEKLRKLFKE